MWGKRFLSFIDFDFDLSFPGTCLLCLWMVTRFIIVCWLIDEILTHSSPHSFISFFTVLPILDTVVLANQVIVQQVSIYYPLPQLLG